MSRFSAFTASADRAADLDELAGRYVDLTSSQQELERSRQQLLDALGGVLDEHDRREAERQYESVEVRMEENRGLIGDIEDAMTDLANWLFDHPTDRYEFRFRYVLEKLGLL